MRSPSRLVQVLTLLAVVAAVAAMVLPWIHNTECRLDESLWEVPTRRHPATITLVAAAGGLLLVGTIGVLTLAGALARRTAGLPRTVLVTLGLVALGLALVAAITVPRPTCFWEDSLGGGSSESIWGPGPVLLLAAGLLAVLATALSVRPHSASLRHGSDLGPRY